MAVATKVGLVVYVAPQVGLAFPFLLVAYNAIYQRVRPTARDTRRLSALAYSPVFSHFADTLAGRDYVRAFGAAGRFAKENAERVTTMNRGAISNGAVLKWAQTLTVQSGAGLYGVSGAVCVVLSALRKINAAELALVLVNAAALQRAAMDLMMRLTALEMEFVSVERIAEYTRLSKVALCGRTGSGKSSLLGALSRLYPIDSGSISLDGVDVCSVGLASVRSAVRVVSQEALLLEGTLRSNLLAFCAASGDAAEPCSRRGEGAARVAAAHDDDEQVEQELWSALELVKLACRLKALPQRLDTPVREAELSDGEKQLFSLCRGMVSGSGQRNMRILCCDEPTSNVDAQSDALVHAALLELPCTVVVIAHRLQQTRHFDRVHVMHAGRIVEEGKPVELLADPQSRYTKLWQRAGLPMQRTG